MENTGANVVTSGESKILEAMQKEWENIYEVAKGIDFQKRWTFDDYSNAAGKLFDEIAKIKVIEPQKYMFNYMLIKLGMEIGDKNIGGFWEYLKRIKFAKPKISKKEMDISSLFVQDPNEVKHYTDEDYGHLWGKFVERMDSQFDENGYMGKINTAKLMQDMEKKFDFAMLEKLALALAMPVEHFEIFLTKVLKRKVIDFYKREEVLLYLTLKYAEMAGELKLFKAYDKLKEMYGEIDVEGYSEKVEAAAATIEYRKETEEILKVDYKTLFDGKNTKLKEHFQKIEIINKTQKVKRTEMKEMKALWEEFSSEILNSKILKDFVTDEYLKKSKEANSRLFTQMIVKGRKDKNVVVRKGTKFTQTIYIDERKNNFTMCSKATFEKRTNKYEQSKYKPDAVFRNQRVKFSFFDEEIQLLTERIVCDGPIKLWKEKGRDNSGKVVVYCKAGICIPKDTIMLMEIDQERFWYTVIRDTVVTREGKAEVYIEPNGTKEQFDKLYYARKLPALWNFRPMTAEFVVTKDTELKSVKEAKKLAIPVEALCSEEEFKQLLREGFVVGKMLEAKPQKLNVIHEFLFDGRPVKTEEIDYKNLRAWKKIDKKGNIVSGTLIISEALEKCIPEDSMIEMKVNDESFFYKVIDGRPAKEPGKIEIKVVPLCTEEEFDEKFYGGKLPAFYRFDQIPKNMQKEHVQSIKFEEEDIEEVDFKNVELEGVHYVAVPKDNGKIIVQCMAGVQIPKNKVITITVGNREFRYRVKRTVEVTDNVGEVSVEWSNVDEFKELQYLGINGFFKTNRTFETSDSEIKEVCIDHIITLSGDDIDIADIKYQASESALLRFIYGLSEDEKLNQRIYHGLSEWKGYEDFYLNHKVFRNTQITLNDLHNGRKNPMDMRNMILTILFFLFTWERIEDEDDAKNLIAKFERRADKILKKCSYQPFYRRGFAYDAFLGLLLNCQQPFYLYLAIWSEDLLKYAELEKNNT